MSEIAKKFMEHSGKDEFGNLVLLFEDKKIKMAFGEDGEPLLCCKDLEVTVNISPKTWARKSIKNGFSVLKYDRGLYKSKDRCVLAKILTRLTFSAHSGEWTRFRNFLIGTLTMPVERELAIEPRTPDAAFPSRELLEYRYIDENQDYCVADNGSVWSRKSGHWCQIGQSINKDGYFQVGIIENGKKVKKLTHRLILQAFKGHSNRGQVTLHWNGVKTDNRPSNLRWGTDLENAQDAARHRAETADMKLSG